jgi:hypothetical protein
MVASLLLFNVCELSTIRMVSDMLQKAVVGGQKRPVSCDCDFHRYSLGSVLNVLQLTRHHKKVIYNESSAFSYLR